MITGLLNKEDFNKAGLDFINLALDQVFALYENYEELEIDDEDASLYWKSAKRPLASALALVQQGIEFLLKSRIASVSPYLLISGEPREWPKGCNTKDVSLSDFRTIDAQDLIRLHDTVYRERLSKDFETRFENLRKMRNSIMHTIDHSLEINAIEIIKTSLEVIHQLIGPQRWVEIRREYLEETPISAAYSTDHVDLTISIESLRLIRLLAPSETIKYFGFNKRQRRYICPVCYRFDESDVVRPNTALLNPNTPRSTTIYCFVCGETSEVIREDCLEPECKCNVLLPENRECLICLSELEKPIDN